MLIFDLIFYNKMLQILNSHSEHSLNHQLSQFSHFPINWIYNLIGIFLQSITISDNKIGKQKNCFYQTSV